MSLSGLATVISLWVRKNLRNESVEETSREAFVKAFKALQPFKSNWSKAVNQTDLTPPEIVDVLEYLLSIKLSEVIVGDQVQTDTKLAEWEDKLSELKNDALNVVHEAAVVAATPHKSRTPAQAKGIEEEKRTSRIFTGFDLDAEDGDQEVIETGRKLKLKQPEVRLPEQGAKDVLDYYLELKEAADDLKLPEDEFQTMFRLNMNSETKRMARLFKKKSFTQMLKGVCIVQEIGVDKIITLRDKLYQRSDEKPVDFLVRWMALTDAAELIDVSVDMGKDTFVSRLLHHSDLSLMLADVKGGLLEAAMAAAPLQKMLGTARLAAPAAAKKDRVVKEPRARNEGRACHYCGIVGHFSANCRKRQRDEAQKKEKKRCWEG
jgi:hypothetical protein